MAFDFTAFNDTLGSEDSVNYVLVRIFSSYVQDVARQPDATLAILMRPINISAWGHMALTSLALDTGLRRKRHQGREGLFMYL